MEAFVLIKVGASESLNFMRTVKEDIGAIRGVKEVYGVFGRFDLIAKIDGETLDVLSRIIGDHIRGIPGVEATETLVVSL